jgi:O-Antigen ligase/Tetratricopeptide repeat
VRNDDYRLSTAERSVADLCRRGAGCEPVVDLWIAETERRRGLAGTQQRARHDGVGLEALLAQLDAERPCVLTSLGRQRAKLVRRSRCGLGMTNDHELHRGQDNRVMARLGGPVGGAAAFALTVGLAFDGGGYQPVSFDRALVGVSAAALLLLVLAGGSRPGPLSAALLAGLGLLTAWTALSWLWSDSPPVALDEARRVAVYLGAAALVVLVGRRAPLAWLVAGIAAGGTVAVAWNLWLRLAPDWAGRSPLRSDIGQLADPVGYANSLALLAALAFVLALGLDGAAAILLVPLAADVALQQSTGTVAALALGLVAYVVISARPVRALALLVLPLAGALAVRSAASVLHPPPTDLLSAGHTGHRLLLLLVLLMAAQGMLALSSRVLPSGSRLSSRRAGAVALAAALVSLAVAPFAFGGHERGHYWRVAWHELVANPLFGSGAGTFADWWLRLRTVPQSTHEAHSLYLETLAELGPIGLALLLLALGAGLAAAWRLRRERLGPALLAALVTYCLAAAVDFHWELAGVTAPAIVLAAAATVHADAAQRGVRKSYVVPAFAALTIAGILALAGSSALDSGDPQRALRFAPYSSGAWQALAEQRRARGDTSGAIRAYMHAVDLDPNDWAAWNELAAVSRGTPRRLALAEAARLNPLGGATP